MCEPVLKGLYNEKCHIVISKNKTISMLIISEIFEFKLFDFCSIIKVEWPNKRDHQSFEKTIQKEKLNNKKIVLEQRYSGHGRASYV